MSLNNISFINRYYVEEWPLDEIAQECECSRETVRNRRTLWGLPDRDRPWDESDSLQCFDAIIRCTNGASLVGDMRTMAFEIRRRTSDVMEHSCAMWLARYAPHVDTMPRNLHHMEIPRAKLSLMKLDPDAIIPSRGTKFAAGIDLHSIEEFELKGGEQRVCHTGIAGAIPPGWVGQLCPRSGLASKSGITVQNSPGIIDSDYRGEWMVILYNTGTQTDLYKVKRGDRIAQVVIVPCSCVDPIEVDSLEDTERGDGGLGSTGK